MFHFVNNFFTVAPICIFFIFYLTIADKSDIIEMLCYAPVAQLDRAIASDAMCRAFESHQVYQKSASTKALADFVCFDWAWIYYPQNVILPNPTPKPLLIIFNDNP